MSPSSFLKQALEFVGSPGQFPSSLALVASSLAAGVRTVPLPAHYSRRAERYIEYGAARRQRLNTVNKPGWADLALSIVLH